MNFIDVMTSGDVMCPLIMGPPVRTDDIVLELNLNEPDSIESYSIEWDTVHPHLLPKMPKRRNYGLGKEKGKIIDKYLIDLREKPPIEYVAEFLCNIFKYYIIHKYFIICIRIIYNIYTYNPEYNLYKFCK